MNKNILVTGGDGMVGSYFKEMEGVSVVGKKDLDVTDIMSAKKLIKNHNLLGVIHLAAETDVDFCEHNPDMAYKINSIGTFNIASICKLENIPMVYVSTAGVFEGLKSRKNPYTNKDTPKPVSVYARSKLLGEIFVQDIVPNHIIARTGWLFGGLQKDKKFVGMIVKQIKEGGKELQIVSDIRGCPTYAKDLAIEILNFLKNKTYGTFHLINKGSATRYEIAVEITKNIDKSIKVIKTKASHFPSFNAPRPMYEVVRQDGKMRKWEAALKDYLQEWKKIGR
jgi:dTDP-4-dehydrorhamnose reductase